jgi:hypothetical protein
MATAGFVTAGVFEWELVQMLVQTLVQMLVQMLVQTLVQK